MSDGDEHGVLEERWRYYVPNASLRPELLPAQGAPWTEVVYFAGGFNGYVLQHGVTNAAAALESAQREFRASARLPAIGLTAARALLFFAQRADHLGGGYGYAGDSLRFIHALLDRIHEHVHDRAQNAVGDRLTATSVGDVEDRVMDAFERFVIEYAAWGGYCSHGWTNHDDPHNYFGPVIRSEVDCTLRFAMELEREWPRSVHCEFPVSKANFANFDKTSERQQRIDLAVSDLSTFVEDETSQERFRTMCHEAFIEVKWLVKGWRGNRFEMDARKRVASVRVDAAKLANHRRLGRCMVAATFVVDDEDYFSDVYETEWPPHVWRLVVGPSTLHRYGLLDAG